MNDLYSSTLLLITENIFCIAAICLKVMGAVMTITSMYLLANLKMFWIELKLLHLDVFNNLSVLFVPVASGIRTSMCFVLGTRLN